MRRIIAGINMTLDGYCDHTAMVPDEEIHQHYTDLLNNSDAILYGRITFELMQYWQPFVKNPSGEKHMDEFAAAIHKIPKIVFSHSLKNVGTAGLNWESAALSEQTPEQVAAELKQQGGRDVLVGSRSIILQLANLNLIDEYQFCVHPVVAGKGLPLFDKISERTIFNLVKTKIFKSGSIILYYNRNK